MITVPPPCASMAGRRALVSIAGPVALTAITLSHSACEM